MTKGHILSMLAIYEIPASVLKNHMEFLYLLEVPCDLAIDHLKKRITSTGTILCTIKHFLGRVSVSDSHITAWESLH